MADPITDEQKNAIYDVLVRALGALGDDYHRENFMSHWPACKEFRFQGILGFGGKIHWRPSWGRPHYAYVSYYPENRQESLDAAVAEANKTIATIIRGTP